MRSNTNAECGSVRFFLTPSAFAPWRMFGPPGLTSLVRYGISPSRRFAPKGEAGLRVPLSVYDPPMSPDKTELRKAARITRLALAPAGRDVARQLAGHADALPLAPGMVVGGYHARDDEADPSLLLIRLAERGCAIAYPRVAARDVALEFHHIPEGAALTRGSFGIHEPQGGWPNVTPDLLLVPLLAFDATGHRLGYGGGYYDRTLAHLNVPAIGIAYGAQELPSIPHEAHDRRLNFILTEKGLRRFS